jgi:hypothetical protein
VRQLERRAQQGYIEKKLGERAPTERNAPVFYSRADIAALKAGKPNMYAREVPPAKTEQRAAPVPQTETGNHTGGFTEMVFMPARPEADPWAQLAPYHDSGCEFRARAEALAFARRGGRVLRPFARVSAAPRPRGLGRRRRSVGGRRAPAVAFQPRGAGEMTLYSTREAARIVGANFRNVDYWANNGEATACIPAHGTGTDRWYTYEDLVVLYVVNAMRGETGHDMRLTIADAVRKADRNQELLEVQAGSLLSIWINLGKVHAALASATPPPAAPAADTR